MKFFIGYKPHNEHAPAWSHERLVEWTKVSKQVIEEKNAGALFLLIYV